MDLIVIIGIAIGIGIENLGGQRLLYLLATEFSAAELAINIDRVALIRYRHFFDGISAAS